MSKAQCKVPSLYTNGGDPQQNNVQVVIQGKVCSVGSSLRYKGFLVVGLQRFNEFCKILKKDRLSKNCQELELNWKNEWINKAVSSKNKITDDS